MPKVISMNATYKTIAWFASAVLLVALGVASSFWALTQIEEAATFKKLTYAAIKNADALMSDLRDAETGQRGYLLTGDEAFLEPYWAVNNNIKLHLVELHQLALVSAAQKHLDVLAPLVDAKLIDMSHSIELRRNHNNADAFVLVAKGKGKQLMDAIRAEMSAFSQLEEKELVQREAMFQVKIRRLFMVILTCSLLALLFAIVFAYLIYRQSQLRLKNWVEQETQRLLDVQEAINKKLQHANVTLRDSEAKLAVTLSSIGDAVIATDDEARVTLLNPVAEQLTGWSQASAVGHPVAEIFPIINKETRLPATIPVMATLMHGTIQGLANHTVLIARDGSECDIADSCAPIRDRDGHVIGAVLVFRDVTGEYAVRQALHDSIALTQTIFNTVVDGIITIHARGGIVEKVNPATEKMFGYSAAELAGRNFSTLIPELDRDLLSGSLEYYAATEEARASGLGREVVGRRKDGSIFPLEIAVSEMSLGGERYFTGILRDITTRKQVEAALLKAGALQRAIFNSANFSSIATDASGVIQIFNVGAERMLGYNAAEVMNKITPADISDPKEVIARANTLSSELGVLIAPGFEALAFKASRGIEDIYELNYIHKNGTRIPAMVSVTALRDGLGSIIGYLLIGTDNTTRKQIEAERVQLHQALQDKNTELERATSAAENANLAKSNFLSRMSHELRTPLNAILGFAQLMESGKPSPTETQAIRLHQITKAGWYLLELINEILDLAVIESGKLSLSHEPVSVIDVIHECQAMMESQAQQHGIQINYLPFDTSWFVYADRTRVKQVVINLLSNAVKYNREQGTVEVACTANTPERIRISVKDSGMGLLPEQLMQLFQPFNRLGQENGIEQGTGIGLVVTKQLVELMGGAIGVASTVGVGSEFWIELIRDRTPLAAISRIAADADAAKFTLLYVEDNPANLMLVEQIVENIAHVRMLSARDGKRGIAMARAELPDVILMDINLPGLSGFQAMQILREDPCTKHIPVVALSANAMLRDIEKGLDAGFFRYLTKPIKINEFMLALDEALKFSAINLTDKKEIERIK